MVDLYETLDTVRYLTETEINTILNTLPRCFL